MLLEPVRTTCRSFSVQKLTQVSSIQAARYSFVSMEMKVQTTHTHTHMTGCPYSVFFTTTSCKQYRVRHKILPLSKECSHCPTYVITRTVINTYETCTKLAFVCQI